MNRTLISIHAVLLLATVGGCHKQAGEAVRDIGPEATAYYQAHPDFFHFATPADLPADLVWHDGHDVPEFAAPEAKRGGTLHGWIDDFPRTLRFYGPDSAGTFRSFILDDWALGLLGRQPNTGQYVPSLARAWAYGKDRCTMYFRLDPDARYCDGVPVRADDYLFAFFIFSSRYIHDPFTNNYIAKTFRSVTKYDDLTIAITAQEPKPDIEDRLALGPVPEHFYRELGDDYPERYQWRLEPTTGPYTVKSEDVHKGSSIDLTRVPHWWADDKPFFRHRFNVDRIHLEVIRDTNKAFESFKRGDVDLFSLREPQYWYDKLPDGDPLVQRGCIAKAVFYNQVPCITYGFYVNTAQPLLDHRDIREGIAYAANFDLVDQRYFHGDYVRMQTSSDGYALVPFPGIHPRPFSTDQALVSFARAGFTKRGPDGILVNGQGQRLSFTVTSYHDTLRDVLTILRQEAAKAGLELNIEILDGTTGAKKIMEKHHQIAFMAFQPSGARYPDYWQMFDSANADKPQTNNITNTVDPALDRLIAAYDRAQTMDEIRRLAYQMEVRIRDDAAFIPAYKLPFFRVGYWRWIKFPREFATRESDDGGVELAGVMGDGLFWIDQDARPAVLAARDSGPTLAPEIKVYDQWKAK